MVVILINRHLITWVTGQVLLKELIIVVVIIIIIVVVFVSM